MSGVKVKDEDIIGHKFHSNSCNDFTVLRKTNHQTRSRHGNYLYEIEFDEVNGIKYKKEVRKEYILKRNIFNPFYPNLFGVGYNGNASPSKHDYEYNKWRHMLSRCYNPKDEKYKNYGAIGVYVCERWKCFEYFLEDFVHIDGYKNGEQQSLDKDIKAVCEPKYYSLDTCCLIPVKQNVKEMQTRVSPYFKAISPSGKEFVSNCQMDFVRTYNLTRSGINDTLRGRQETHRGWRFKYIDPI